MWIVALLIVAVPPFIGAAAMLLAERKVRRCEKIIREGIRTEGIPIRTEIRKINKYCSAYYPIVGFYADGVYIEKITEYTFWNFNRQTIYNTDEGKDTVYYLPGKPDEFIFGEAENYISKVRSDSRALMILIGFSSVFMAFGVALRALGLL